MTQSSDATTPAHDRDWEQAYSDMVYWKFEGILGDHHIVAAVGFMERALELKPGDTVLDLGCGLGRHSIELARRGYNVTGLEYSAVFLEAARKRVTDSGVEVRLLQGDMIHMDFEAEFDAVILWGNTFAMFAHEDNVRTLDGMRRALKPGGRALIDTQNYAAGELVGELKQGWGFDEDDPNLLILTESTRDARHARFGFNALAIDLATGKRHSMPFSWRLYLLPELEHVIADGGLGLVAIYGDDPEKVDWKSYRKGDPTPYSVEGFTERAAKRVLLCQRS